MEQKNIRARLPLNALAPETALRSQVFLRSKGLALSAHRLQCFIFSARFGRKNKALHAKTAMFFFALNNSFFKGKAKKNKTPFFAPAVRNSLGGLAGKIEIFPRPPLKVGFVLRKSMIG